MSDHLFKLPSGLILPMERLPQREDDMTDQLYDLWSIAMRLGLYKAGDFLRDHLRSLSHGQSH